MESCTQPSDKNQRIVQVTTMGQGAGNLHLVATGVDTLRAFAQAIATLLKSILVFAYTTTRSAVKAACSLVNAPCYPFSSKAHRNSLFVLRMLHRGRSACSGFTHRRLSLVEHAGYTPAQAFKIKITIQSWTVLQSHIEKQEAFCIDMASHDKRLH